jgi:hypothetical protein
MSANFSAERIPKKPSFNPAFSPPVRQAVSRSGQSLEPPTCQEMESRFQHDFSDVRIHSGPGAAEAAESVGANAFTVGPHIVFGAGRYEPHRAGGRKLLAHELAHVVQQDSPAPSRRGESAEPEARAAAHRVAEGENAAVTGGVEPGALQRDDGAPDDEERRFQLRMPQFGESLGLGRSRYGLGSGSRYQLRVDPEIQAQIRAITFMRSQLSLDSLQTAASRLSSGVPSPDETAAPDLSPRAAAQQAAGTGARPDPFSLPPTPEPRPLVPAGRGPDRPRPATVGDVVGAFMRIPAVQAGVTRLREQAEGQIRRNWSRLSGGERALVITHGVLLGATTVAGLALSPEARQMALDQIQGRDIPLPGLPVTVRFNLTGPEQQLFLGVNVGQLLPPSLGFR